MASSPAWKVYTSEDEYVAAFRYPEDAACLLAMRGRGTQLRYGHNKGATVWVQEETGDAGESYDAVAARAYSMIPTHTH